MVHTGVVAWEPSQTPQQSREGSTLSLELPARHLSAARFPDFSRAGGGLAATRPPRVALFAEHYGFECVFPAGYLESAEPCFVEIVDEMCALRTPPEGRLRVDARLMPGDCPSLKAVRGSRGLKFHATLVASEMRMTPQGFAGEVRREFVEFVEHYTGTIFGVRGLVDYVDTHLPGFPRIRAVPADHVSRWFEDTYKMRQLDPGGHHLEIELWLSS